MQIQRTQKHIHTDSRSAPLLPSLTYAAISRNNNNMLASFSLFLITLPGLERRSTLCEAGAACIQQQKKKKDPTGVNYVVCVSEPVILLVISARFHANVTAMLSFPRNQPNTHKHPQKK